MNSEGLIAVKDGWNKCVHLLSKEGALVRSIGKGGLTVWGFDGITFDLKGNVWVADRSYNIVLKLSQDGRLLQTIDHAGDKSDHLNHPTGVSVTPEGLIVATTVSPFTMKRASFSLLLDQREVAQGVLIDLMM